MRSHLHRWGLGFALIVFFAIGCWWWSSNQRLRRQLRGMTPSWGMAGVHERRPGARESIRQRGPSVLPQLIRMLDDHDRDVRGAAASALAMFPERADLSVPALLQQFDRTADDDRWGFQTLGATLGELLPATAAIPAELTLALRSEAPLRRMIAVDLVLRRKPDDTTAQAGLLRSLEEIREDRTSTPTEDELVAAYHAVHTLTALTNDDRSFALAELERIAGFSPGFTDSFSEIGRLSQSIRDLLKATGR